MKTLYHAALELEGILKEHSLLCTYGAIIARYPEPRRKKRMVEAEQEFAEEYRELTLQMATLARSELTESRLGVGISSLGEEKLADEAEYLGLDVSDQYREFKRNHFVWLGGYEDVKQINGHRGKYMLELSVPDKLIREQGAHSLVWWKLSLDYLTKILTDKGNVEDVKRMLDEKELFVDVVAL